MPALLRNRSRPTAAPDTAFVRSLGERTALATLNGISVLQLDAQIAEELARERAPELGTDYEVLMIGGAAGMPDGALDERISEDGVRLAVRAGRVRRRQYAAAVAHATRLVVRTRVQMYGRARARYGARGHGYSHAVRRPHGVRRRDRTLARASRAGPSRPPRPPDDELPDVAARPEVSA